MGDEENPDPAPERQVVVVGPDGHPIGEIAGPAHGQEDRRLSDLVEQPAKVMRIGSMIKQLLDEVREAPLDEAARARLRQIHQRSITELEDGLAPELVAELERLSLPFTEDSVPSESELRIAQAQLVGWLEGLFHGIQTAMFAQQVAAKAAFDEMRRRALEGGQGDPQPQQDGRRDSVNPPRGSGPYL